MFLLFALNHEDRYAVTFSLSLNLARRWSTPLPHPCHAIDNTVHWCMHVQCNVIDDWNHYIGVTCVFPLYVKCKVTTHDNYDNSIPYTSIFLSFRRRLRILSTIESSILSAIGDYLFIYFFSLPSFSCFYSRVIEAIHKHGIFTQNCRLGCVNIKSSMQCIYRTIKYLSDCSRK